MTTPSFTFADAALVVALAVTFLAFVAGHLILHPKIRNGAMLSETQSRIAGVGMIGIIWTTLEAIRVLSTGMAPMQPVWDWWAIVAVAGVTVVLLWLGLGNPRDETEAQRKARRLDEMRGHVDALKEL